MDTRVKSLKVMPKMVSTELPQTYTLSKEQLDFYNEKGFLVIKQLIDFTTLYACKQRFIQIAKGQVERGPMTVMREPGLIEKGLRGEDLINKVQDILYDDVFVQYTENPRLLHVVSQLIGEDIRAMHSMFINKPPGTTRHPSHQDLYYFPFRPAEKIVASWTAVDDVYRDNGCLYVVPGSHALNKLYAHGKLTGASKLYHGILDEDIVAPLEKRIHLEMSPGDTVFFHPMLVHGSGPNTTKNYRKCVSCHYANAACEYIDVSGTVQEDVAAEVVEEAKRRGLEVNFAEVWRYRSKHVRGVTSHL